MMKMRILGFLGLLVMGLAGTASGASQADFQGLNSSQDTLVSTSAWTLISSTTAYKSGVIATLLSHYPANVHNFILRVASGPLTAGTTAQGFSFKPTDPPWILSFGGAQSLWAVVDGTTTQRMYSQELKGN